MEPSYLSHHNTSLFRRCDPQTSMNADECMVLLGLVVGGGPS